MIPKELVTVIACS